jgi:hypothetical protein
VISAGGAGGPPPLLPRGFAAFSADGRNQSLTLPALASAFAAYDLQRQSSSGLSSLQHTQQQVLAYPPPPQPQAPVIIPAGSLESGVAVLCWGPEGYTLVVGGFGAAVCLLELPLARSLPNHHRVAHSGAAGGGIGGGGIGAGAGGGGEELHVLQAHDRLLLVTESLVAAAAVDASGAGAGVGMGRERLSVDGLSAMGGLRGVRGHGGGGLTGTGGTGEGVGGGGRGGKGSDLTVTHIPLPQSYMAANWPVRHVALSASGGDVAVAGRAGLALYNRAADR